MPSCILIIVLYLLKPFVIVPIYTAILKAFPVLENYAVWINNNIVIPISVIIPTVFCCVGFSNIAFKVVHGQLFSTRDFFCIDNNPKCIFVFTTVSTVTIWCFWRLWTSFYNPSTPLPQIYVIDRLLITLPLFLGGVLFFFNRYIMVNYILLYYPDKTIFSAIEYSRVLTANTITQLHFFTIKQWFCILAITLTQGYILALVIPYLALCYGNIFKLLERDYQFKNNATPPPNDIFKDNEQIFGNGNISTIPENLDTPKD